MMPADEHGARPRGFGDNARHLADHLYQTSSFQYSINLLQWIGRCIPQKVELGRGSLKKKEWVPNQWAGYPKSNWPAWMDEYYPIDAEQEQPHLVDAKLERAGNQILQACAAKGVDVIRLFQCADVGPDFYGPTTLAEEELLGELETICFKEGVTLADLEALIIEQPQ